MYSPVGVNVNVRAAGSVLPFREKPREQPEPRKLKKPKKSFELRYSETFLADDSMRIGGITGGADGAVDQNYYTWNEEKGEYFWRLLSPDGRCLHALEWLKTQQPDKARKSDAKSAANTAALDATGVRSKWVAHTSKPTETLIGVRGAYLRVVRDIGRVFLRAEKPSKSAGLTYVVPAKFDWSRVSADGAYTPHPVDPQSRFGAYLDLFMPDLEVRALLQEAVGSTVLNRTYEKCFWFQGEGSNGKSTLLHLLRALHPKNVAIDLTQITARFGSMPLVGATLATVSECGDFLGGDVEQKIKAIVSRDPMPVEEKGGNFFTIVPRAALILLFNKAPRVTDHSYGFWSKMLPIPFNVQLARDGNAQRIVDYHKLITDDEYEMSQLLDWVLEGALRLDARGRFPDVLPAAVQALMQHQRSAADNVLQYLEDSNASYDSSALTLMPFIYEDYVKFCLDTGVRPIQNQDFWTRVRAKFKPDDLGHVQASVQSNGKRPRGVRLRVDGVPVFSRTR